MAQPIGPTFTIGDKTILADGTQLLSVYANGKAPLSGGGANGVPLGRYIGRVWRQGDYGWVAAPRQIGSERDSWSAEVERSHRFFRTRRDAAMFLYGYANGVGRVRFEEQMSQMPRPIGAGNQPTA